MSIMMHSTDSRNRRTHIGPVFPVANYCTDVKTEMNFGDDIFHSLHLIPEPLKKNLADTLVINQEYKQPKQALDLPTMPPVSTDFSPLSGIASFFSGMLSALSGAVFKRARSPPGADVAWQEANTEYENGFDVSEANPTMAECKVAACEDKLAQLRQLLTHNTTRHRPRKPRRMFVEPGFVEEHFEDAFSPEDFVTFPKSTVINFFSPVQYQEQEYFEVDSPKMRLEVAPVLENNSEPEVIKEIKSVLDDVKSDSPQVVVSCEDKLSKLKALLQNKCKNVKTNEIANEPLKEVVHTNPSKSIPIDKTRDKRFKNPHRTTDKRQKAKMKQSIQEDLLFANEICLDEASSVEDSPSFNSLDKLPDTPSYETPQEFFDEISGRFRTASASSEDSYQIVFNDIPKRARSTSECDSEDSFIVFEDSPDSCYTSNDVFGDSDCSDSDSDVSDSGCDNMRLTQSLSRTVSNLTDDSLYDEVDCARTMSVCDNDDTGLLIDEKKKALKKTLPPKKVRFSEAAPRVMVMRVWSYAARQARMGNWQQCILDRERFSRRIADVDMAVSWVLKPQHRARIMFQRFMPWWNAQKRQELAEKKQKKEDERLRAEALENAEVSQSGEASKSDEDNTQNEIGDKIESVPNSNLNLVVPNSISEDLNSKSKESNLNSEVPNSNSEDSRLNVPNSNKNTPNLKSNGLVNGYIKSNNSLLLQDDLRSNTDGNRAELSKNSMEELCDANLNLIDNDLDGKQSESPKSSDLSI